MRHKKLFALPLVVFALLVLALFAAARADDDNDNTGPYRLITTVPIPGNLGGGFDISWVDSEAGRYYLANRGSVAAGIPAQIEVIDTRSLERLDPLHVLAAPNGIVVIPKSKDDDDGEGEQGESEGAKELWVGENMSHVEVINLKTGLPVANIPTFGAGRADELGFDPVDHILLVANDRETVPFVTFIDTKTYTNIGKIDYPQVVFGSPATNHGLEQPVWNPRTKKFYLAIPGTSTNPKGEVDEIAPPHDGIPGMVTRVFKATCNPTGDPAGLVLVPHQRLVSSCGDIISIASGDVLKTVPGLGGDEIWFNSGDDRVYFGGGLNRISVPVLDIETNTLVSPLLTVGKILFPPPDSRNHTTHSVAADSENNRIFVPVSNEGVKVYTHGDNDD